MTTTTAIKEYTPVEIALADLRRRTEGVLFEVTSTKGMADARKARQELVGYRVDIEKIRVELKAPLLDRGRLVDAEAKRITAALTALEDPIDAQIKAEEKRKTDEKARRERLEAERIAGINRQLDAIRHLPLHVVGKSVGAITQTLVAAGEVEVAAFPPEFRDQAQQLVDDAVSTLTTMRDERLAADRETKRLAEERAQLEADQKAERLRQAEADRAAQAERERLDTEARAARERQEAAARAEHAHQEEVARAARERIAAAERIEQQRVAEANRVEAERLAHERAELEQRQAAERRAAEEREIGNATLVRAAHAAVALLRDLGRSEHFVTRQLVAALEREEVAA